MRIKITKNEFYKGVNSCDAYLGRTDMFTSSQMVFDILKSIFGDKLSVQDENKVVQRVDANPGKS